MSSPHLTVGTFLCTANLKSVPLLVSDVIKTTGLVPLYYVIGWFGCMCVREGGASRLKYGVTVRYLTTHIHIYIELCTYTPTKPPLQLLLLINQLNTNGN
jgi:hypothetical protein